VPVAPRRVGGGLCACDRAGLRPLRPPPPPAPSRAKGSGPTTVTAKADIRAYLIGILQLEVGSTLPRYTMNIAAPGGGWSFAGQKIWEMMQNNEMKAKAALPLVTVHNPIQTVSQCLAQCDVRRVFRTGHRFDLVHRMIEARIGRKAVRHGHAATPFRTICRSRWAARPRLPLR
jgi:hypothetical protein